ncbi:hypothetical protein GYMLUDRAFT_156966, partial [Collybiopsis luxurians FD-317 M1]
VFLNKKPDVSCFRTFGCGTYVFVPIDKCSNKFEPHSEAMTFIGYDKGSKEYLFMHNDNTIYPASQGTFYEKWFPRCKSDENRNERPSEPIWSNPGDEPDLPSFDLYILYSNILFTSPDDDQSHPPNEHHTPMDHPSVGNTSTCTPSLSVPDPFSYNPEDVLEWQHLNPGPRIFRAPSCPGFIPTPVT